jgi:hypothetical protein
MKINWKDLSIQFQTIEKHKLIEDWIWLVDTDKDPIMISSIGDMFLKDKNGKIYWLDVGRGSLELVSENLDDFKSKLNDDSKVNEWFMIGLVKQIKETGLELVEGKLYGYKKLPIIGGEYKPENFELTSIEVHFSLSGQILRQLKDLPDGTNIQIKVVD